MIIVFPCSKLISLDSITPILLEVFVKYGERSNVVFFDEETYKGVVNNIVLFDALNTCGKITYINKKSALSIFKIIYFYLIGFFRAKYIHFGILDYGVLGLIWSTHRRSTYYSQKDSYDNNNLYYRNELLEKNIVIKKPKAKNIIAFNKKMPELKLVDSLEYNIYLFGETRTRYEWIKYTKIFSENNALNHYQNMVNKDKILVYILGPFCEVMWMKDKDSYLKLFRSTIRIISENFPNIKVLLKPHITTDLEILHKYTDNNDQFEITNLHPSVLSNFANCFVVNLYSTTFADAYNLGVYTIEYTNYTDKVLSLTKGESINSQYVDFFINNSEKKFIQSLKDVFSKNRKPVLKKWKKNDESGLLEKLSS
jgi:hypothetical protein